MHVENVLSPKMTCNCDDPKWEMSHPGRTTYQNGYVFLFDFCLMAKFLANIVVYGISRVRYGDEPDNTGLYMCYGILP